MQSLDGYGSRLSGQHPCRHQPVQSPPVMEVLLDQLGTSMVTGGWIINRTPKRYQTLTAAIVISGILFSQRFSRPSVSLAVVYMLALGFATNFIPATSFTLAPETMPSPQFAGLGLALMATGMGVGGLTGPPMLGSSVNGGNWTAGSMCLVMVMGLGAVAMLLAWQSMRRK